MISERSVLILYFLFLLESCDTCPSMCVCKWKNGKQTVECNNKGLLAIPKGMDPGTQVLEFSSNNVQSLPKEKFLRMDLINLQRIYLSRCKITTIDDRTFKGLTNLVELDLSGNSLGSVPSGALADCPSLMRLTLNANPIRSLRRGAFNHLYYLNTLELGNCEISLVEEGSFETLQSLEWLHLDGNKLTTLRGKKVLPDTLRGVELQANPWECDCHILELHEWLRDINIPHSVEPVCNGPSRLSGRAIKSITTPQLACLPDVSPTTLYLEIGEGKNVSLLCHVRAIPEARVSWWFQGRVLQNDSFIAPGVHLIFYIEEGVEEKKSELFIYNTNSEDNGTFICSAENSAGMSQSNYTLRIILREEPNVVVISLPTEYILIIISAIAVLVLVLFILMILVIIKCCRNRKRKRRNSKIVTASNSTKDSLIQESTDDYSDSFKESSNLTSVECQQEMMLFATSQLSEEMLMSPVPAPNQVRSPTSLRRYQLEQNPDLINDTESRRCEGDGEDRSSYGKAMENAITDLSTNMLRGTINHPVHLNPVGLLNGPEAYRTLPHKRVSAANPPSRYSREAEFLSSYEHYCDGIRYTADGYPARETSYLPSPPEGYKTEPCCSAQIIHWSSRVPANLHVINQSEPVTKKCIGAQTDETMSASKPVNKTLCNVKIQDAVSESPDEGYEGEVLELSSNS